jgi:hypothetical protein
VVFERKEAPRNFLRVFLVLGGGERRMKEEEVTFVHLFSVSFGFFWPAALFYMSHSLTVRSPDLDAISLPSGEKRY